MTHGAIMVQMLLCSQENKDAVRLPGRLLLIFHAGLHAGGDT
jgi:hypothetical protein